MTIDVSRWTPESMLEVKFDHPDDFKIIMETLERIGVASRKEKKLYQSCHILHKQGRYFIVHFKELFLLDGKVSNLDENDVKRRNTIAVLLSDWGLVELIKTPSIEERAPLRQIKILKHSERNDWDLVPKYTIGNN